jgi:transcriptional regulator with XRE-family HTH domain
MELLPAAVEILSPAEMHALRKQLGVTYRALSKRTGISAPQLCLYERGANGLTVRQAREVRYALVEIACERSQVLSKLLGPEMEREMAAAS